MRKSLPVFIALLHCLPVALTAQQPRQKVVATAAQLHQRDTYAPKFHQQTFDYYDHGLVQAGMVSQPTPSLSTGKTSAVNPIALGTASNALTCLRTEQNQVSVDNATDAVAFIHRQDITVWGGAGTENGKYRYDISIDGGSTFNNDIGPLQTIYTNYGRYPNGMIYNSTGTSNPLATYFLYLGPANRFPTPGWVDQVNGVSTVATSGAPTATEHYQFDGQNVYLPGGLCQGKPGEFWSAELAFDGNALMDSIRLYKGTWNTNNNDVDWVLDRLIDPGYDKSFDGSIAGVGPNVAFSPDGMTGYIGMLGNVTSGTNTNNETVLPIFFKTTDGGVTWSNAIEVDLDAIPWIADSLQTLWIDSTGAPASDGRATTGFDYDITVDGGGNVHMGVVIGTAGGGFAISSGLAKFLGDVTSRDGGATWEVTYLSPVLTFRGSYGGGSSPITVDNYVQAARDDAGDHVFFSWVDSDTSQFTGSMNGIGFGENANLAPNLRVVAKDLVSNTQTYPRLVTDGDLIWEGRLLCPTMAPIVRQNGSMVNFPIVAMEFLQNDPNLPVKFWYFGGDISLDLSNSSLWCYQPSMDLGWLSFSTPGATPSCAVGIEDHPLANEATLYGWVPNPTHEMTTIGMELPVASTVQMEVLNVNGQSIAMLANGEFGAGRHQFSLDTRNLAAGIYFCTLQTNGKFQSQRLVVTK